MIVERTKKKDQKSSQRDVTLEYDTAKGLIRNEISSNTKAIDC
ncbi:hypothetical protein GCM10025794_35710 [Massilia kyonggiensis]